MKGQNGEKNTHDSPSINDHKKENTSKLIILKSSWSKLFQSLIVPNEKTPAAQSDLLQWIYQRIQATA